MTNQLTEEITQIWPRSQTPARIGGSLLAAIFAIPAMIIAGLYLGHTVFWVMWGLYFVGWIGIQILLNRRARSASVNQ